MKKCHTLTTASSLDVRFSSPDNADGKTMLKMNINNVRRCHELRIFD